MTVLLLPPAVWYGALAWTAAAFTLAGLLAGYGLACWQGRGPKEQGMTDEELAEILSVARNEVAQQGLIIHEADLTALVKAAYLAALATGNSYPPMLRNLLSLFIRMMAQAA